jgi:hypothetical protein
MVSVGGGHKVPTTDSGSEPVSNNLHAYNSNSQTSLAPPRAFTMAPAAPSNIQLGLHTTFDSTATLIVIQRRLNLLLGKLLHLLRRRSHDTLDEFVLETGLLDVVGSLTRQHLQNPFTSGQPVTVAS